MRLQAFARQLVSFLARYDALLTPALAERPLPLGTLDTAAPDPMSTFTRSGPVHAVHARLQRERAAGDLAAALRGRGRPAARRADRRRAPPARSSCSRSPTQLEAAQPWARAAARESAGRLGATSRLRSRQRSAARAPRPSRCGVDAERLRVGAPRAETHRHLHQLGLVPSRERARPIAASSSRSARETIGVGTCTSGRLRPSERSTMRTISSWLSVSGPASS